ncbi:MAG: hypothetical protein N2450_06555 [bacterium]|nr:hypothetical protein [bacterium]
MHETLTDNIDKMEEWFYAFPYQLKHTLELPILGTIPKSTITKLYLCGMGGSAISGELFAEGLSGRLAVSTCIVRDSVLPLEADEHSGIILLSYSGNTSETLSLIDIAQFRKASIGVVTSGGKLLEWAKTNKVFYISVPPGYAPRAALGYLFTGVWRLAHLLHIAPSPNFLISDIAETLCGAIEGFRLKSNDVSPFHNLIQLMTDKILWIWSSSRLSSVARRWANQFSENSKLLAHWNVVPEVFHNEIVGLCDNPQTKELVQPIFLIEEETKSFIIAKEILQESGIQPLVFRRTDPSISGLLYLVLLGDFLSIKLAKYKGILPTPIPSIEKFKTRLSS